jgi:excisionase family DNA binding protein
MNKLAPEFIEKMRANGYLTAVEAASMIGVSVYTVYRLCTQKNVEHKKVGTKYFISKNALVQYYGIAMARRCGLLEATKPAQPTQQPTETTTLTNSVDINKI